MPSRDAFEISDGPLVDWLTARRVRANLMVLSEVIDEATVAECLTRWFPAPTAVTVFPGEVVIPPAGTVTWFLLAFAAMTEGQQHDLERWLAGDGRAVQIISISAEPVWPLVEKGQFLESLYYRLNTIMLDARPTGALSNYDEGSGAPRP